MIFVTKLSEGQSVGKILNAEIQGWSIKANIELLFLRIGLSWLNCHSVSFDSVDCSSCNAN
jgi:hypothetical protein